ncbi:MAG TPA: hypothetical protein VMT88_01740 [Actinomycetes bacterium]|nr:hypothetical protein [Actinomycetes bacterium]
MTPDEPSDAQPSPPEIHGNASQDEAAAIAATLDGAASVQSVTELNEWRQARRRALAASQER